MSAASSFYVYAYRIDGQMAYVGKGKGKRAWVHLRGAKNAILRQRIANGRKLQVRVLKANLSEPEALALERRCIKKWQRSLSNIAQGSRSEVEALWYECLNDLQTHLVSYGQVIVMRSRCLLDLETGAEHEQDSMRLRVRNLMYIKRRLRRIMRAIENTHPHLIEIRNSEARHA
jgi:hypothetical protein